MTVELAKLASRDVQHQSWQIEATNLCFLHVNVIGELIDAARQEAGTVKWPAVASRGRILAHVHIHGAHYTIRSGGAWGDVSVFDP